VLVAAGATAVAAESQVQVLVLYSNGRLFPGNVEGDRGLFRTVRDPAGRPVTVFSEFLDSPRCQGPDAEAVVTAYLQGKYATEPPRVLVAVGEQSLGFLLRHRAEIAPQAPVVHVGVDRTLLSSFTPQRDDVVGVPVDYSAAPTVELALRLHPRARRLVIVTGASAEDAVLEDRFRAALAALPGRATVEMLEGLPTPELLARLGSLGPDAVVVTPGFFGDGDGRRFTPFEAVEAIAAASGAPVYGPFSTFIGAGIVGGSMPSFEAMGRQAGLIVNQLLAGADPAALELPEVMPQTVNLDWRQLERWGIDEGSLPADAEVHFKPPSLLDAHRGEVAAASAVLLLQAGLIGWLLAERRRRRNAELAEQAQRAELAHASRLAVAGELTGSLAHEINQPLGAILSNADAAELILAAGEDRRDELRNILSDIRRDDLRASEVIRRLRSLLARHEVERRPLDLEEVLRDSEVILGAEARRRRVAISFRNPPTALAMVGDRVQMQQVVINLVLNAMDAVADLPEERRNVVVSVERGDETAVVLVHDSGPGIPLEHLPRVFEPFFTTKRGGMGLGLSIVRTLVEAHGGVAAADNAPDGGAVLRVELPLTDPTDACHGESA
jgi:signal transduction histidine kinase